MIWFDLERNNAKRKTNQILIICKDMNAFCWSNSVYYIYIKIPMHKDKGWTCKLQEQELNFWTKKVSIRFHSTGRFKAFQGQQSIPGNLLKLIAPFTRTKTLRIVTSATLLSNSFWFLITYIHEFSMKFNHVFLFIIRFWCFLNRLIEF